MFLPFIRLPIRLKVFSVLLGAAIISFVVALDTDKYYHATLQSLATQSFALSDLQRLPEKTSSQLHLLLGTILFSFALIFVSLEYVIRYRIKSQHDLLKGVLSVTQGHLDITVPSHTRDEMHDLIESFNEMVLELRKKRTLQDMLKKYIDPKIALEIQKHPSLVNYEGGRQTVTALFCDLKAFTELGEKLPPQTLVALLNKYFTLMSDAITEHDGIVDKFIGDSVMAYWAPPFCPLEEEEEMALQAALAMQKKIKTLQEEAQIILGNQLPLPAFQIRIGIATGPAVIGNIGPNNFKSFTVIGDTINLASRLENANKWFDSKILISEETAAKTMDLYAIRELDTVLLPGKKAPEKVFEVLVGCNLSNEELKIFLEEYALGLCSYRNRDWLKAKRHFSRCLQIQSQDRPSSKMLERCDLYYQNPPTLDWSGVSFI